MVSLSKAERFFAAHCALLFTTSIAAILVAFALAWLARRRRDPARWCLALIKFAALFYILSDHPQTSPDAKTDPVLVSASSNSAPMLSGSPSHASCTPSATTTTDSTTKTT